MRRQWQVLEVTMCQGNRVRLREAARSLDLRAVGFINGPTKVTLQIETQRTPEEVEDALRGQLMFNGWMSVEVCDLEDPQD